MTPSYAQIEQLIDRSTNDDLHIALIDLMTHDPDELLKMLHSTEYRFALASQYSTSPATITRIAQMLLDPTNYRNACNANEFCEMHRCDINICIDDEITECAHLQ